MALIQDEQGGVEAVSCTCRSERRRSALGPQCVLLSFLRRHQVLHPLLLCALFLADTLIILMLQLERGWRLLSLLVLLLRHLLRVGRFLPLGPPFGLLLRCLGARSLFCALCVRCLARCERR